MPDVAQREFDRPFYATAAVAAGAANVAEVTITAKNANGKPVGPTAFQLFLSDSAAGVGVTATTASGAVTDKTAGTTGIVLGTLTSKKSLVVQTLAAGTYVLSITDTAKTLFKVCVQIDGIVFVVATLATASYG